MENNLYINVTKTLSNDELDVLSLLYLPIIKKDSFSLYLFMHNVVDKKTLNFACREKFFLTTLFMTRDEYLKSKGILEAVGLISSFENEDKTIIKLNKVLDAQSFLQDSVFGLTLFSVLSEEDYKIITNKFKVSNVKEYIKEQGFIETSKTFNDYFKQVNDLELINETYKQESVNLYELHLENFDLNKCFNFIPNSFINDYQKQDESLINLFKKTSFVYNLDEVNIAECYKHSLGINGEVDEDVFSSNARKIYNNLNKTNKTFIISKNDNLSSDVIKYQKNFVDFLSDLSNSKASTSDVQICEKLWHKNNVSPSLINFLIEFGLKQNNNKMYSFEWYDKVLQTWLRSNVKSVNDAINYLESVESNTNKFISKPVISKKERSKEEAKEIDFDLSFFTEE